MNAPRPRITVIGSINMDLVVRCSTLAAPGQTILADSSVEICGGKGANQAIAAARAGGEVSMIGRVGDDAFGRRLTQNLTDSNINVENVFKTSDCASGLAVVAVERSGQNSILVVPNANGRVCNADIEAVRSVIESSDIVLLQLEIPIDVVLCAMKVARDSGVRIIVDPAPVSSNCPQDILHADLVCPNEAEAAILVSHHVETIHEVDHAAQELCRLGAANVAITLGDRGTYFYDGKQGQLIPPFKIDAVDSTAAGDAFAGALAVYWAEHGNLIEAIKFGNAAGAIAASRAGAQPSIATRSEIEDLWRKQ